MYTGVVELAKVLVEQVKQKALYILPAAWLGR